MSNLLADGTKQTFDKLKSKSMSFPEFDLAGDIHPCYFYLQELKHCFNNTLYGHTNCKNQQEDLMECHNREKQSKLLAEANRQLRRSKVVNVPTYDRENDQFVFDDGKVVKNDDPIFKRFKWM